MAGKSLQELGITADTIRAYDQRIPRYTSYPTAPFWVPEFGPVQWGDHLRSNPKPRDLALYVHIPFCQKRCLFCACNVIISRKDGIADDYLDTLEQEVRLLRSHMDSPGRVIQLHLGGGTPNYLTVPEMTRLVGILESAFEFAPGAERSIEVDPRQATPEDIAAFGQIHGFRRISFGVQDFYDETQFAIGREQTLDCTFLNVNMARKSGFESVNIDLIYGLPRQTRASWTSTLNVVSQLRPDRIALYNFAFLPTRLAHQRMLEQELFPPPEQKLEMFIEAHERLTREGWNFIGMDHYALESDSLSQALRGGTLRRNFMGYNTLRGTDMLSFGTSSISNFRGAFAQNVKKLSTYRGMIAEGVLPVERGLRLSPDDLLRQFVIEELMCNGVLRFDGEHGDQVRRLVEAETPRLLPLAGDGLVELDDTGLRVTHKGRIFLRNIAVLFDAYIQGAGEKPLFSRAV